MEVGEKGVEGIIDNAGLRSLQQLGIPTGGGGNDFNGAVFNINVPDGKMNTFMSELQQQVKSANLKRRG